MSCLLRRIPLFRKWQRTQQTGKNCTEMLEIAQKSLNRKLDERARVQSSCKIFKWWSMMLIKGFPSLRSIRVVLRLIRKHLWCQINSRTWAQNQPRMIGALPRAISVALLIISSRVCSCSSLFRGLMHRNSTIQTCISWKGSINPFGSLWPQPNTSQNCHRRKGLIIIIEIGESI